MPPTLRPSLRLPLALVAAVVTAAAWAPRASAHDATFPIAADKILVDTSHGKTQRKFQFKAKGDDSIRLGDHDPSADGASLVVRGVGGKREGSTGLIRLPAANWRAVDDGGEITKYVYKDKKGKRGGITKMALADGKLQIKAKGKHWDWVPGGKHDVVWTVFYLGEEQYCAAFEPAGTQKIMKNGKGVYEAKGSVRPGACPEQLCGNAEVELGEACDDGNLDETDGCNNDCTVGECIGEDYATTFDAIQGVIFDSPVYGCTNELCHDAVDPEGNLDLTAGHSYANLVDVASSRGDLLRVKRNEPELSFLYEKLLAKVEGRGTDGSPMPSSGPALTEAHLRGIREWIRGGAPEDKVVEGTQADLGSCLPEPDPLKIPPVDPPAAGTGVQVRQPPRPLPAQSESEICMTVYYDFTDLVPDEAKIPCPQRYARESICDKANPRKTCSTDDDCGPGEGVCKLRSVLNEGNQCFALNRLELLQDPQSHHSIQFVYAGSYDLDNPGWGEWRYQFDDPSNPLQGMACDPKAIDPALGVNPGCATVPEPAVACIGYGPPDLSNIGTFFGDDAGAINLNIAQEPIKDLSYPEGVYEVMPLKTAFTWNSHAFNLTKKDTTLAEYLNIYFAPQAEQSYQIENIFDAASIFVQGVPPFETREYCRTYTAPKGANIFRFSSHTHRTGTLFRIWAPPNEPCEPRCDELATPLCNLFGAPKLPECPGPRDDEPIYYSTLYSDPVQLYFDPPVAEDEESAADRTYYYCAFYDNGSTPSSPHVKRQSTTPDPPNLFPGVKLGGPCFDEERYCLDGPNKAQLCDQSVTGIPEESFCETKPGKGNGVCDACVVQGGVTTEDEMMVLFGDYFCPGEGGCQ